MSANKLDRLLQLWMYEISHSYSFESHWFCIATVLVAMWCKFWESLLQIW